MKRLALLAALVVALPDPSSVYALGGGHGTIVLPPPPPPGPPPPPPPPPPPRTSATGAPSAQAKTGSTSPAPTSTGGAATGTTSKGTVTTGGIAPKIPTGPASGVAGVQAIDLTTWEYWWLYNKEAYLDVKRHIEASAVRSGPDAAAESARAWDEVGERILPEIVTALQSNTDYDPRMASLIALARMCDGGVRRRASDVATLCKERQNDPNRTVAEASIMALGILGSEATVPELCALLRDTPDARRKLGGREVPERTRAFAALSLGLLGARTTNEDVRRYAVHSLTAQLSEPNAATPDTHAACSIALGLVPLGATSTEDSGASTSPAGRASDQKGCLAPDAHATVELDLLLGLLKNPKAPTYVRAHLPQSLARLASPGSGHEKVVRALLDRLADPTEKAEIVQGCALALGTLSDAGADKLDVDVRGALTRLADEGDVQARCFALIALAQNAGRGEGPGLEATRTRLTQGIEAGRSRERTWSALALGVLEHSRRGKGATHEASAATLVRALKDARAPEEVGAFAIGCGLAGVRAATPLLIERLSQVKEARALGYVQVALGLLDAPEALSPLNAMLAESRLCSEKLPQTALALTLLEDPLLVPNLIALLGEGTSQSTIGAAASALGAVGDRRAVEPLLALLHDAKNTPATHAAAIAALGRICDRDRLPWQHAVSIGLNYRAMTATLSAEDRGGLLDLH